VDVSFRSTVANERHAHANVATHGAYPISLLNLTAISPVAAAAGSGGSRVFNATTSRRYLFDAIAPVDYQARRVAGQLRSHYWNDRVLNPLDHAVLSRPPIKRVICAYGTAPH